MWSLCIVCSQLDRYLRICVGLRFRCLISKYNVVSIRVKLSLYSSLFLCIYPRKLKNRRLEETCTKYHINIFIVVTMTIRQH